MKIIIICNNSTGLYSFRSLLIETLIKKGNTVKAIVPVTNDEHELLSEGKLKEIGCGLIYSNIDRRGINPLKDMKLFFKYVSILREEHPDFVVTYTIKPNIYGSIVCRLIKTPYAVNITGLGTAFEGNGIVKRIVCSLYRIALKKTKVVFFENSENCDVFVDLGLVDRDKTKVLAGAGVDLEKFSYADYPVENGDTCFLFIGRVMQEKGIDELIEAMRHLQKDGIECSLDVVGWLEEDYMDKIRRCENEGWLRYHGVQSDVRPFIMDAHCFVLPSWHEGMANTNLECAASGRPVITSNIHGCLEAVVDGESGFLVESKNADALCKTMSRFAKLPYENKVSMGRNGRKHMEQVFDKKKVVEETIATIL